MKTVSRRQILTYAAGLAAPSFATCALAQPSKTFPAPLWSARQFHNQPEQSPLHRALVRLWANVKRETKGRLDVTVYAQNNQTQGSDPEVLKMLVNGDLQFYTLMGGILANLVPAMDVQGLPYVFKSSMQVYRAMIGPLGDYLRIECAKKGVYCFRQGTFENGFRDLNLIDRRVYKVEDMAGLKIRVPNGQMFRDFFTTIGAEPVTLNINELYSALKDHRVDGHENPLVVIYTNRLYEVTKYISVTHHMWSGFNLLANDAFWSKLPIDVQRIVNSNIWLSVTQQRVETITLNQSLVKTLVARGMVLNKADTKSFRQTLSTGFYQRWKDQIGQEAWRLLEQSVGKIT